MTGSRCSGRSAPPTPSSGRVSLRLLRHHASSVHHQQYHDTDIVTVRVDPPRADPGGPT